METDDIMIQNEDIKNMATPTSSQEKMLLDENAGTSNIAGDKMGTQKSAFVLAPAKLVMGNEKSVPEAKTNRGEITIALKPSTSGQCTATSTNSTEALVPTEPRARSKAERNAAKRAREAGETPPNAQQPNKKNRQRKNKSKQNPLPIQIVVSKKQPNDDKKGNTKAPVPPVKAIPQSSGSGAGVNTSSHPTVDLTKKSNKPVPPEISKPQLIGSGLADVQSEKQPQSILESDSAVENEPHDRETYAEVANNLCAAVIDQRGSGSMTLFDQKRFDTLYSLITDKVLSQAGKNISPPAFDDTRLHSGAMRVRCANFQTRKWLEKFIPTLDKKKLWKDASLVVINFSDIPKPHKFNVFVRGIKKSAQDIFKLFEVQNKGIITKSWTALACEYKNGGTAMTIGVGQDSFEILRQRSNSLYCGLGKASFNIVKGCKENRDALHQSAKTDLVTNSTNSEASSSTMAQAEMDVDENSTSSQQA